MIRYLLAALFALALPAVAHAEVAEGSWALRIDDANIFVFVVERTDSGQWFGRWLRPASFRTNGAVFSQVTGSTEATSIAGREVAGEVELVFIIARDSNNPITFRFRQAGPGQAELTYVDTPLPPFPLVAVAEGAALGPFDPARIYDRDNAATRPPAAPAPTAAPLVAAPSPSSSTAPALPSAVAPLAPAPVTPAPVTSTPVTSAPVAAPSTVLSGPAPAPTPAPTPPSAAPAAPATAPAAPASNPPAPVEPEPRPSQLSADFLDDL